MKRYKVGIIGLGYVGLKEAVAASKAGHTVIGYDISKKKINELNRRSSPISTVCVDEIEEYLQGGSCFTDQKEALKESEIIIIAVPTPLTENRDPDLSAVRSAFEITKENYNEQIIVLESTTYPGCTEELAREFFGEYFTKYAFCGEREDPGGLTKYEGIPRVLGAEDEEVAIVLKEFYESFICSIHTVQSATVAEITKLFENVFRSVNIGLINEIKRYCIELGVDPFEVVKSASTKPFGFKAFSPGPGLGGHCIPIDPFYMSWAARRQKLELSFIHLSGLVNDAVPAYVCERVALFLNTIEKPVRGSTVLICGVAYKRNIEDTRNSPANVIMKALLSQGARLYVYDPVVAEFQEEYLGCKIHRSLDSVCIEELDCSVIVADHDCLDYEEINNRSKGIVDTRGRYSVGERILRA